MKLVFLYGPPAVGKLTVAKELSKLTSFKIFHNHLTIDLVESVFEWGTALFDEYVIKYRLELLEAAAKAKVPGLITTYVFENTQLDISFVKSIQKAIERQGGEICFVQLLSDEKTLIKRVKAESRKKHNKVKTVATLKNILAEHDVFIPIPSVTSLTIDNTKISAQKVAQQIQKRFQLKQ